MKKWICSVCGSDRVSWPVERMLNVPLAEDTLEPVYDDATTGTYCYGCEDEISQERYRSESRSARNVELREVDDGEPEPGEWANWVFRNG